MDAAIEAALGDHDAGDHAVNGDLEVNTPGHLEITGCGAGTRIILDGSLSFGALASFALKDVEVQAKGVDRTLTFVRCREVALENCRLAGVVEKAAFLTVGGADRVRLENNRLKALPSALTTPSRVFSGITTTRSPRCSPDSPTRGSSRKRSPCSRGHWPGSATARSSPDRSGNR